ncbi:hypothetical protein [Actibacterium pelagium]|nr:hypothetical protein [Actibacterium pelagium]
MAVPPQMVKLNSLLGLQVQAQARADMKLADMLPKTTSDAFLRTTLNARAPQVRLPAVLPPGGGAMISMMTKLGAVSQTFPITNPRQLMAQIQQALKCLASRTLPQAQSMPPMVMQNMVLAARMTLTLRARGICPMALARVDASFAAKAGTTSSGQTFSTAMGFAATLPRVTFPPFALPGPRVQMAWNMAALGQAAALPTAMGLPPMSDPSLTKALLSQLGVLSTIPVPDMPVSLDDLKAMADKLEDLATIQEAFGPDALTPAGVSRVNAMLRFMSSLKIPLPLPAQTLQVHLDALPDLDDVLSGMQAASSGAMNIAASMSVAPPPVPIMPLLEQLANLSKMLNPAGLGPCQSCAGQLSTAMNSMSGMQLPSPPPLPPLPF